MTPKISIKAELDHIRQYPGMYIGNTYTPDNLLREAIDNSLDEVVNGFADTINVDISPGHIIISDNGRGIPIHEVKDETTGIVYDSIVAACTKLHAGAKFDNNAYKFSVGMHGIGLKAVNALSSMVRISVKDHNNKKLVHDYLFENSDLIENTIIEYEVDWSTRIEFKVNPQYFTNIKFNEQILIQRFKLVLAKFPDKIFIVNGEKIPSISMENYLREILDVTEDNPFFKCSGFLNTSSIDVYFTYNLDSSVSSDIKGDVNLLSCSGTFQSTFQTMLGNILVELSEGKISKSDTNNYLRGYISIQHPEPSFDSQSKSFMNKNIYDLLDQTRNQIRLFFMSEPYLKESIATIIELKTQKKAARKTSRKGKRISGKNPLKDALQIPGETLYIVEGESAGSTIAPIRNRATEGVLPLSGKILNAAKKHIDDIIESKKFTFLLEAIGIEIGKKNPSYRYKHIKILGDADNDGKHIAALVLMGLWYYAPDLITEQKVSIILPPLYGVVNKKQFIPIYQESELQKYQGQNIVRFKGLGEMNTSQMETILKNPYEYIPQPPKTQKEANAIVECMRNTELKRELCANRELTLKNLF